MKKYSAFWNWFQSKVEEFSRSDFTSNIVDQIHENLIEIDERLALEVSELDEEGRRELIMSANGFEELFEVVETIVGEAPVIDGWVMIALKPARGFDFVFKQDGLELRPAQWSFRAIEDEVDDLGLQIQMPDGQDDISDRNLEVILEIGLGEKQFSIIKYIEPVQSNDPETSGSWLPIGVLASFLNFRARRLRP